MNAFSASIIGWRTDDGGVRAGCAGRGNSCAPTGAAAAPRTTSALPAARRAPASAFEHLRRATYDMERHLRIRGPPACTRGWWWAFRRAARDENGVMWRWAIGASG